MQTVLPFILVGIGGFAGSLCRYGATLLATRTAMATPFGTLVSNVTGCLLIGILTEIATFGQWLSPSTRLLLATGFCGGFTTLSSLIHELAQMVRAGQWLYALLYLNGTIVGAALAFLLGVACVRAAARLA